MQNMLIVLLQMLYAVCVLGLALYGFQTLWLTWQLWRKRPQAPFSTHAPFTGLSSAAQFTAWPAVTVQLPIYNERHVIERLIDACAKLSYPADKLQIQVLDDSTDETVEIVQRRMIYWQRKGIEITAVRRADRQPLSEIMQSDSERDPVGHS